MRRDPSITGFEVWRSISFATKAWYNNVQQNLAYKLGRKAADVLKDELLLRSEQELRQKLDKLDPGFALKKRGGAEILLQQFIKKRG